MEEIEKKAVNQFTIFGTWELREEGPESTEELGKKVLQSLDDLTALCPLFRPWIFHSFVFTCDQIADMIDDGADLSVLSIPLDDVRESMTALVESGVSRDDGEPDPAHGYTISASNLE